MRPLPAALLLLPLCALPGCALTALDLALRNRTWPAQTAAVVAWEPITRDRTLVQVALATTDGEDAHPVWEVLPTPPGAEGAPAARVEPDRVMCCFPTYMLLAREDPLKVAVGWSPDRPIVELPAIVRAPHPLAVVVSWSLFPVAVLVDALTCPIQLLPLVFIALF